MRPARDTTAAPPHAAGGAAESDEDAGHRRCAVRGAIVAAVGAAVIAGSGTAAAATGDPPDPVAAPAAAPAAPESVPGTDEPADAGTDEDGVREGAPRGEDEEEASALPEGPEAPGTPEETVDDVGGDAGDARDARDAEHAENAAVPGGPAARPGEGTVTAVLPTPEAGASPAAVDAAAAVKGLEAAVAYALAHVGDVYALGGTGPHRWDCSGLVQVAYRKAGARLPRIAADQYRATTRIPRGALRRGDLVFWSRNGKASGVHHVAIYLGSDRYLEAARPGTKVRISTFARYKPNLYGRVRLPAKAG
ncbi:C40 family peptidase [Streptomyces huiliensis]|uniref:C40 family peptidase n=1 Tax=Streptomyces huiliensis TaxID=2876027 RepID=UPI001CBD49FE|nr:C40 family peptidase [Streptomyces huiliensis]MBZ4319289.1 C40 family peptidase [Streptomyces huiliensis]